MANDGPPWVVGQNCNVTLRHPDVGGDVAAGFYVKPDTFRTLLPKVWYRGTNASVLLPAGPIAAGKRVLVHADGTPSQRTASQWHDALLLYTGWAQDQMTLIDPSGVSWVVAVEEVEDRLSPLGGQFLLEWETRVVFLEL